MDERMKSACVEPAPPTPHITDMLGELEAQQTSIAGMIAGIEWRVDRKPEPTYDVKKSDDMGYRARIATLIDKNVEILRTLERITCGM